MVLIVLGFLVVSLVYLHNWIMCVSCLFFLGSTVVKALVENGNFKKKGPTCQELIAQEQLKRHTTVKKIHDY